MRRVSGGSAVAFLLALCTLAALGRSAALGKDKEPRDAKAAHAPTDSASIAAGARLFAKYCVPCHGASGHGDGPAAAALKPKPRDFGSPKNFVSKNDDEVFAVISKGGASRKLSPMMAAWGTTLTKAQIWQLIAYVRGFPARDSLARAHEAK